MKKTLYLSSSEFRLITRNVMSYITVILSTFIVFVNSDKNDYSASLMFVQFVVLQSGTFLLSYMLSALVNIKYYKIIKFYLTNNFKIHQIIMPYVILYNLIILVLTTMFTVYLIFNDNFSLSISAIVFSFLVLILYNLFSLLLGLILLKKMQVSTFSIIILYVNVFFVYFVVPKINFENITTLILMLIVIVILSVILFKSRRSILKSCISLERNN